ncbi:GNAT family N-acetyltransferase [Pelagicoccus sp. SDUM812002]|uniref:GNAT family N-acetyltransferase n=1 Tax=Pelagicoccus sp. SDUM812002 TaxID=3041266 RepID=UPI00280F8F67|nr:GNAT family N-acetyltransferase [Pelagicoccus sp. SDUM812002]MDQ8184975.1 GNAT family N-acetyltransferase [Pelagicoccus sp. SDUM812002]
MDTPREEPQNRETAPRFEFREFTISELAYKLSLDLRNAYLRAPLGLDLSEQDTSGEDQQLHFGLFEDPNILASVTLKPLDNDRLKLRQMVVDQSTRGCGLGRVLITKAEHILRERGYKQITLSARLEVKSFYEKLGYKRNGARFLLIGIEHVTMDKEL